MKNQTNRGAEISRRAMLPLVASAFLRRAFAGQLEADEYEIKAAMLFTLSKFVEWPLRKMADASGSFVFGVMNSDVLARELEKTLAGKSVAGRPARLRRLNEIEGAQDCHMLFVGGPERKRFQKLAENLLKSGVLTVGEGDRFIDAGGMIALVIKDDRVQFEVNLQAAQRGGFAISSRILRLATVRGGPHP